MGGIIHVAETTPVYFGVQGGEEQVLENSAVVGVATVRVIVLQRVPDLVFHEQPVGDESLLLDEPDEHEARDEPDDVFLGRQDSVSFCRELSGLCGAVKPLEQFAVEASVEFLGVQRVQPGGEQSLEFLGLSMGVHPVQAIIQRDVGEDVQMRAVRAFRVYLADK